MTRDEFMDHARKEIDEAFREQKNRMMNLIGQAWAEGKRNAEADSLIEVLKEKLNEIGVSPSITPQVSNMPYYPTIYPYWWQSPTGCPSITPEGATAYEVHLHKEDGENV